MCFGAVKQNSGGGKPCLLENPRTKAPPSEGGHEVRMERH
jgi:hypothetical protein